MDVTLWTMFFAVFLSTAVVPGPNVAFSVAQSLSYGARRSMPAAAGFSLGTGCHALVVLSGVGLLAQEHHTVLVALKWAVAPACCTLRSGPSAAGAGRAWWRARRPRRRS